MSNNYSIIVRQNLDKLYADFPKDIADAIGGFMNKQFFRIKSFLEQYQSLWKL